jgi:hypothetical protein
MIGTRIKSDRGLVIPSAMVFLLPINVVVVIVIAMSFTPDPSSQTYGSDANG